MKDDLWVVNYCSWYVAHRIIKGSRPLHEQLEIEDEMELIEKKFLKRFGIKRGLKLISTMKEYNI